MEFYKLFYRIHNRDDWWRLKNYIAWLAFCKLTFSGVIEMEKKLLADCELYKCKDCKNYIVAEFKRWCGKKPLTMGHCAIRNSRQDKSNCRLPNQYACKKFKPK